MKQKKTGLNSPRLRYFLVCLGLIILVGGGWVYRVHSDKSQTQAASVFQADSKDTCANSNTQYQNTYKCYKTELTSVIMRANPETATSILKQNYAKSAYIHSDCHQLMHIVGRAAYDKYGDLATAFAHGDQFCWSGFYHGIMEQVSTTKGYDYIYKHAATICQPIAHKYGDGSFNDYNCIHGLGHGFMEIENQNLFSALKSCDATGSLWNQESCTGGVFMQNVMNVQGPEAQTLANYHYLSASDPMYPCDEIEVKYQGSCYLMQTSFALQVDNYDFSKVFAQCAEVNPTYVDTCYQSLGRDASGQSISDIARTKTTCLISTDLNAQTNCTIGAVKDFVSYFHSDSKGYALCAAMPDNITPICNSTVKDYYSTF